MDEHISKYSSFEAFCISVCSSLHTGAYPISESIGPSAVFIHLFDLVIDSLELHTGAYPHSPRSSDLSQASLSFDLVVDPHELLYWGISPPIDHSSSSVSVRVLGRTYINRPSSYQFSLSRDRTYIDRSLSCQLESGAAPISIGHIPISSVRVGTAPISIGHSSCQFESGPHLYRSAISVLLVQFESGPHLYDRSLSCQFESGPHLYDRPSLCHDSSVSGTAPIRSVIIVSV
uniref:Uncharacterized protein n=1 Tax=Vitis vinifera TaxID=29760 RepID=A5B7S0_VITVI|nr:hypothetical protein VITISV_005051 [Vitis vinifera]